MMATTQNGLLLIADEVQLIGGEVGPTYEIVISRARYVSAQTEIKSSLANDRHLGEWMPWVHLLTATLNFSPRYPPSFAPRRLRHCAPRRLSAFSAMDLSQMCILDIEACRAEFR